MKRLGIGMVGYGGIGRVHALAYRSLPYHYGFPMDTIRIVGVATGRPETAEAAAREIGCDVWTTDYHELLERDDIQVIDCCVPNNLHREVVLAAAARGKHVYCEKPLAMSAAEGQEMVRAVEQARIKTQVAFQFRFFPALLRARQLMDEGFVGRVFSFRARYDRASYISPDKPLSWRLRREQSRSGALFDLGSHALDLVYYLLGDFGSVYATLETLIKERPVAKGAAERAPVDVDDIALLQLRLADGTVGVAEATRMATGATNNLQIEIFGDKGAIRFDSSDPGWLDVYDVRDPDQPLGGSRGFRRVETMQRYAGALAPDWTMTPTFVRCHAESQYQFLKAISEDRAPAPDFVAGQHVQEVMEAALRSAETKRWVSVAEVRVAES